MSHRTCYAWVEEQDLDDDYRKRDIEPLDDCGVLYWPVIMVVDGKTPDVDAMALQAENAKLQAELASSDKKLADLQEDAADALLPLFNVYGEFSHSDGLPALLGSIADDFVAMREKLAAFTDAIAPANDYFDGMELSPAETVAQAVESMIGGFDRINEAESREAELRGMMACSAVAHEAAYDAVACALGPDAWEGVSSVKITLAIQDVYTKAAAECPTATEPTPGEQPSVGQRIAERLGDAGDKLIRGERLEMTAWFRCRVCGKQYNKRMKFLAGDPQVFDHTEACDTCKGEQRVLDTTEPAEGERQSCHYHTCPPIYCSVAVECSVCEHWYAGETPPVQRVVDAKNATRKPGVPGQQQMYRILKARSLELQSGEARVQDAIDNDGSLSELEKERDAEDLQAALDRSPCKLQLCHQCGKPLIMLPADECPEGLVCTECIGKVIK